MHAIIKDGQVLKILNSDDAFTAEIQVATDKTTGEPIMDAIQYPAGWLRTAPSEKLAEANIVAVEHDPRPDDRYNWVTEKPIAFIGGAWRITYAAVPKDLEPLKAERMVQVEASALSLLAKTDWQIIRAIEQSQAIDQEIKAARAAIRNWAMSTAAAIETASTVDELAAISLSYTP